MGGLNDEFSEWIWYRLLGWHYERRGWLLKCYALEVFDAVGLYQSMLGKCGKALSSPEWRGYLGVMIVLM
jgi:hypothetical protein